MDTTTVLLGALALVFGVFAGVARVVKPEMFAKLEPMKKKYGDSAGNAIHFISYVVAPVIVGLVLLVAGSMGVSLFGGGH